MAEEAEFLHGPGLAERIRRVCSEDAVDCAVAFLGRGMRAELFQRQRQVVRIVCDIAMGCTSKRALLEFGAPADAKANANPNLHVRDWLHAKVYVSSAGAVIGSPNLSSKALGVGSREAGNLEAGTYHPAGSKAWNKAKTWFDEVFASSKEVSWSDVERAAVYANDPGRGHDPQELIDLSLLERIRRHPEVFQSLSFLFTTEDLSQDLETKLIDSEHDPDSSNLSVIVWSEGEKWIDVEKSVIAFHRDDSGGRGLNGYVRCRASAKQHCLLAFGVKGWASLRRAATQVGMKKPLTAREWQLVQTLWEGNQTIFSANELADALDEAAQSLEQA